MLTSKWTAIMWMVIAICITAIAITTIALGINSMNQGQRLHTRKNIAIARTCRHDQQPALCIAANVKR